MITHILYHRLDAGELAIYDKADEVEQYWHLDPPYWNCHTTHHRISNFTNLQLSLEDLQRDLPQWLQALPAEDGSLIYSVHLNYVIDGVHLIDAGLSFVSYPMGVPLTVDPVQAILDLSRAHATYRNTNMSLVQLINTAKAWHRSYNKQTGRTELHKKRVLAAIARFIDDEKKQSKGAEKKS